MDDVSVGEKSMIFGQLVSVARLFAQFHAGTKNFSGTFGCLCLTLSEIWPGEFRGPRGPKKKSAKSEV